MQKLALSALVAASLVAGAAFAADPPAKPAAPGAPKAEAPKETPKPALPPATPPPPTPSAPAIPPPAPELDAWLKDLAKATLTCKSKVNDTPFGKGYNTTAKFTVKKELNGYFYTTKYEEAKVKEMTSPPYISMGFIGFDPTKKQLTRTDLDGMGGIAHGTSAGWEGDKLVFNSKNLHGGPAMRETFVKAGKEFKHTVELQGDGGAYFTMVENLCK